MPERRRRRETAVPSNGSYYGSELFTGVGEPLHRIASRLRFWMLGVLVVLVAALEVVTGLPGLWGFVVYGAGVLFFALVMIAVIDREGRPMGDRGDFQHGRDIHGHYR